MEVETYQPPRPAVAILVRMSVLEAMSISEDLEYFGKNNFLHQGATDLLRELRRLTTRP